MMPVVAGLFSRLTLPQASTMAGHVDALYNFLFWASAVSFVIIVAGLVYFSHRYMRRGKGETTPYIEGHTPTEVGVAVGLFLLVMGIFYWGYVDYAAMRTMPVGALEINVVGRQWAWEFQYPNGRKLTNEVTVPLGRKVKFLMTSNDVLHSLFIPNFRVKQDLIPGAYTALWFEATQEGAHDIFCAEYCGTAHSQMLAKLTVRPPAAYEQWQLDWELHGLREASAAEAAPGGREQAIPPAELGARFFAEKGCPACHSTDGSKRIGPSLKEVFGTRVTLADGTAVAVDENYLRESLMEPQAKLVQGYDPVMPTYKGQLPDEEITAIIEYVKSLK